MENLQNQDLNQEAGQNNNGDDKVSLSKEEYERLLNSEKELGEVQEKYRASTKEGQKLSWIAKVSTDNSKFIKLYKSDKKQAEEVAKHFGYGAKDFYDAIVKEYGDNSDNGVEIEDVDERVQKGIDKGLAEESLKQFKEKYGIKGKLEVSFEKEFKDLMGDKEWTPDTVKAQAKRALKLVADTAEFQEELNKANSRLAGAGITGNGRVGEKGTPKSQLQSLKEMKKAGSLLESYGISKEI